MREVYREAVRKSTGDSIFLEPNAAVSGAVCEPSDTGAMPRNSQDQAGVKRERWRRRRRCAKQRDRAGQESGMTRAPRVWAHSRSPKLRSWSASVCPLRGPRPSTTINSVLFRRANSRKSVDFPMHRLPRQATRDAVGLLNSRQSESSSFSRPRNIADPFRLGGRILAFRAETVNINFGTKPIFDSFRAIHGNGESVPISARSPCLPLSVFSVFSAARPWPNHLLHTGFPSAALMFIFDLMSVPDTFASYGSGDSAAIKPGSPSASME